MAKVLRSKEMNKCLGCFTCMSVCSVINEKDHSLIKSSIKIRTTGGMTSRFISVVCLGCVEPACMEVCPTNALTKRKGGGVVLNQKKCIGCRLCQPACIVRAVNFDEDTAKPIICRHCGTCARFCPHDCLQMIEVEEVSDDVK
ncbi:MAG: [Fe-S]-binding protein [Lachnospiraceae bacterium]|nr:[Fe-S]-binding protein [Lachnospiraceae bacterium]